MNLYMEHKWVKDYSFPQNRGYIIIIYVAYGSGSVKIGNRYLEAVKGDIFVISPNASVNLKSKDGSSENYNFEVYYILFQKDFLCGRWEKYSEEFNELDSFFRNTGQYFVQAADGEKNDIRNIIVRMMNEYYENNTGRKSVLLGNMIALLPLIFRRIHIKNEKIFSLNTLVDQTIRYIKNTLYKNPKLKEIAENRYVTPEHLSRVFKHEIGMTVIQYMNNLRIEEVKDILENTDRPIEHISMLFNVKPKSMQQMFKRTTGMSMREYRKKYHF